MSHSQTCYLFSLAGCLIDVSMSEHRDLLHSPDSFIPVCATLKENLFNSFSNVDS